MTATAEQLLQTLQQLISTAPGLQQQLRQALQQTDPQTDSTTAPSRTSALEPAAQPAQPPSLQSPAQPAQPPSLQSPADGQLNTAAASAAQPLSTSRSVCIVTQRTHEHPRASIPEQQLVLQHLAKVDAEVFDRITTGKKVRAIEGANAPPSTFILAQTANTNHNQVSFTWRANTHTACLCESSHCVISVLRQTVLRVVINSLDPATREGAMARLSTYYTSVRKKIMAYRRVAIDDSDGPKSASPALIKSRQRGVSDAYS